MQYRKGILLLLSVMLIFFMFGCGQEQEEVETMPEVEVDEATSEPAEEVNEDPMETIEIQSVFPSVEGFMWQYDGPVESGKTVLLHKIEETKEGKLLHVMAIMNDASGEKPMEERVVKSVYTVTDEKILENGREILKAPLKVGNQWSHKHVLRDSGEVRYATTRIVEVTEDTVKTETRVDNVFGYPEETYLETNVYSAGAGFIDQKYSVQGMEAFELGYFVYKTFMKPYDEEGQMLHEKFDIALFEGEEIKAFPIVAYDNYLIGGTYAGKWVDAEHIAPKLVGQETYQVYNQKGKVEEGLGTSPVKERDGFQWYKVDILSPFGEQIKEERDTYTSYNHYFSEQLAFSADWNPMPRPVVALKVYNETYRDIVNTVLEELGMGHVPVAIKQILKTDLEGDGQDEVVITASSYDAPIDFMSTPDRYSIVILRKLVDGQVKTSILAGDYHYKDETNGLNYLYYVPFILDLNGDGRMEIVTEGMYYEGQWLDIIDVDGETIQSVLADGPQL